MSAKPGQVHPVNFENINIFIDDSDSARRFSRMPFEKRRVLVVDDEPAVSSVLRRILGVEGFLVASANDAPTGLRMFKEESWDLVITDLKMAGWNGEWLAQEIRAISQDCRIILITGFQKSDTHFELFNEVLEKPFIMKDLVAAVRRVLE